MQFYVKMARVFASQKITAHLMYVRENAYFGMVETSALMNQMD